MPLEKAYTYFGSMDMRSRISMAIGLIREARWPRSLQTRLEAIRKALGKDGEHLSERRNRVVHGVHKPTGNPEVFSLTLPRERGVKREVDVSINDLHVLVTRLSELATEIRNVSQEYGEWKFGPSRQQHVNEQLTFLHRAKSAIVGFLRNL